MKKLLLLALSVMLLSVSAFGAKNRIWGTGKPTGTYIKYATEILEYCPNTDINRDDYISTEATGAVDNIDGLMTKKYRIGMTDIATLMVLASENSKINDKKLKVIAYLDKEPVNIFIPFGYKPENPDADMFSMLGDKFNNAIGNVQPVTLDINTLKDQIIVSNSGSSVVAKALSNKLGLNFRLKVMADVGSMINSGKPIMLVGSSPFADAQKILNSGKYMLVEMNHAAIAMRAPFFEPAVVSYKVNGKLINIPTISSRALLIGKASKKISKRSKDVIKNQGMRMLATCIADAAPDLAEESDLLGWEGAAQFMEDEENLGWDEFEYIEEDEMKKVKAGK